MKRILAPTVIAAGLALSGYSHATPSTVVVWEPLPPGSTTTTTTTTTLAPEPTCRASQLQSSPGQGGAAAGNEETQVLLTNTGPACQLGGYPALIGISLSGEQVTLNTMHGTFFTNPIPGDISRGQQGELLIGTTDACTALNQPDQAASIANEEANTYVGAILTLPNGAGVISVSGLRFDTACSLDESQGGVEPPQAFTYAIPAGSPQSLSATLRVPASVRSGTEMDYQVVLDNTTSTRSHFTLVRTTRRWSDCDETQGTHIPAELRLSEADLAERVQSVRHGDSRAEG